MILNLLISGINLPINFVIIYTRHDGQCINLKDKSTFKTLSIFKQATIFKLLITGTDSPLNFVPIDAGMMLNLLISGTNLPINFVNIYTDHDAQCINLRDKCSFIT